MTLAEHQSDGILCAVVPELPRLHRLLLSFDWQPSQRKYVAEDGETPISMT